MTIPAVATPIVPVATALLALWVLQLCYPPLSYPSAGLLQVVTLFAIGILLPLRAARTAASQLSRLHPALAWGAAFILWVFARWAVIGLPVNGAEEVSILVNTGAWLAVGYGAAVLLKNQYASLVNIIITAIAVMGLVQGGIALWQYFISYNTSYDALMQAIGNRPPDNTELGLLYHLKLRRVAGWFGDPNALACFSAVALCASLELLTRSRSWRLLALVCGLACLVAIYLSGSRGGALDAFAVITIFGGWIWYTKKGSRDYPTSPKMGGVSLCVALILGMHVFSIGAEGVRETSRFDTPMPTAWAWRSSTIQERLYYYQVGLKMVERSPLTGLGPGSVDTWFGRLKLPEARETRYLHNWPLQVAAEYGFVGLALLLAFLVSFFRATIKARVFYEPGSRALLFIAALILADALVQVTWNQREIMTTWGLLAGILLAGAAGSNPVTPNPRRYYLLILPTLLMLLVDYPYLSAKAQKQLATDDHYSGRPAEAEKHWMRASKWWPNDPEPYAARASMALGRGEVSAAEMLISTALKNNPDSAMLNTQAAEISALSGKLEKADAFLTRALELYPTKADYNFQKAALLLKMNRPEQALPFAENAVRYNYTEQDSPRYNTLLQQLRSTLTNGPDHARDK